MQTKTVRFFAGLLIAGCMIVLTGCGSVFSLAAKQNAVSYIKHKYHFRPKVIRVTKEKHESLFTMEFTGRYHIEMEHDGKQFGVSIGGSSDLFPGKDNYQADEIAEDLMKEIAAQVGEEPDYYQLIYDFGSYNEFDRKYDNYFETYYDGTNLYEILDSWNGKMTVVYTDGMSVRDVDLSPIGMKFAEGLEKQSLRYLVINLFSFASEEDFELDRAVATERDLHLNPAALRRDLPHLVDAQVYRVQKPSDKGRIVYTNTDYGYEYTYHDKKYRYLGEGCPENPPLGSAFEEE